MEANGNLRLCAWGALATGVERREEEKVQVLGSRTGKGPGMFIGGRNPNSQNSGQDKGYKGA